MYPARFCKYNVYQAGPIVMSDEEHRETYLSEMIVYGKCIHPMFGGDLLSGANTSIWVTLFESRI